ncbi:MAG: hypothetical protein HC836_22035 [Richelia sp. RM2_1_2]|nr:hypothetical protein [Richelia sp. RM1_1_1]NJO60837.1 hypothetical protein [Richelia sp. RM2_1_2]
MMMIFVVASGYLFAVYIFLALAKRIIKKTAIAEVSPEFEEEYSSEMLVTPRS